jgi:hypothetical protein
MWQDYQQINQTILQTVDLLLISKMIHCTDEDTSQQTQLLEKNNAKINDKNLQKSINQSTLVDPS